MSRVLSSETYHIPGAIVVRIVPEVLKPPLYPVSRLFQYLLGFVNFTCWLTWLTLNLLLMPMQLARLDPAHRLSDLLLIAPISLLSVLLVSPMVGALSDRTSLRFGRRRPWLLAGTLLVTTTLLLMLHVTTFVFLLLEYTLFQIGITVIMVSLNAIIPDQVPHKQHATIAAIVGLAQPSGAMVGTVLLTSHASVSFAVYYVQIGMLFFSVLPFLMLAREKALPSGAIPARAWQGLFRICWVEPLHTPGFGLTWLTRSLVYAGYALLPCSLPYLLQATQTETSFVHFLPAQSLAPDTTGLLFVLSITIILTAPISGMLCDRWQQRKAFVIVGGLLIASTGPFMIGSHSWLALTCAIILFGVGFATYFSADLAFTMQFLPSRATYGRDMGLLTIASMLPQVPGPGLAALLMALFHSNTALCLIGALFALAGTLLLRYPRGDRQETTSATG